jgi:hypothetical protein
VAVDFDPQPQAMPVAPPSEARLPHISNAPFYLAYHPLRWSFLDGEFLPNLLKIVIEPGVGGVDKSGDSSLAETLRAKQGKVILPWSLVPPGTPGGQYIHRFLARGPKGADWYHCEVWETPRQLAGRVMQSVIDTEGRRAWLRWLVAEGHIPQISDEAREFLAAGKHSELQRLSGKAATAPERVEAARQALEAMAATKAPPKRRRAEATP